MSLRKESKPRETRDARGNGVELALNVRGCSFVFWNGRRLVATAAALHVTLAVALFVAGRTRIAPTVIDRDGIMASFALDSYGYQRDAIQLAELLRSGKVANWVTAALPIHAKIIAIPFALLGWLFGYGTLSAEPYNLLFYATVIALVFALGREVCSQRVGLLAGAVVAVYPSFLLHTMQLLKDPLVVTLSLAFVLCLTTWLTRTFSARSGAVATVLMMFLTLLIFFARPDFVIVFFAAALIGLALLVIRQLLERRYLFWNLMLPLPMLLAMVFLPWYHSAERMKQFPANQIGPPKITAGNALQVPAVIVWRTSAPKSPNTFASRWRRPADTLAKRVGSLRLNFALSYRDAGSVLDGDREFNSLSDLVRYIPRAIEIGLWAPFPNSWISTGRRVGSAGKLLAGAETFFIYLFQLLAVCAVMRERRRLALWFLLAIATLGATVLALVVPNVGALYRYRYAFWMMVIVIAMTVVDRLLASVVARLRVRQQYLGPVIQHQ
jgi:hypothetical protein